jgi:hypothetical protein
MVEKSVEGSENDGREGTPIESLKKEMRSI